MAELKGSHVLAIAVGAFGIIIGVNLLMAYKAISTFPGLEVENSYVASQEFDRLRAAQKDLGWSFDYGYQAGRLTLAFTDKAGTPLQVGELEVLVGRTTEAKDDVTPEFTWLNGSYEATVPLQPGRWMIRIRAKSADGTLFQKRDEFSVRG
ncbi:MAG: FixH family protein [Rhodobacteraceae bacterium]|jgi:nitrogen fixation protein FixH|nr:FixH family protein [Paracoccaceae bacterium]